MAQLKTDKIALTKDFQIKFEDDYTLTVDVDSKPTLYTLTHGKKSINFHSDVATTLCLRQYGIRLVKGRRQMVIPPKVLQNFADYAVFLPWYDPCISANHSESYEHVTSDSSINCCSFTE